MEIKAFCKYLQKILIETSRDQTIFLGLKHPLTENMGSDFRKSNDDIKEASLFFDRDLPPPQLPACLLRIRVHREPLVLQQHRHFGLCEILQKLT